VGEEGHYYHQHLILPNALRLLNFREGSTLLDLACGEGVMSRQIPEGIKYWGLDIAPKLIEEARKKKTIKEQQFLVADITKDLPIEKKDFSHAAIILALQNIKKPFLVIRNAAKHLIIGGKFLIVINHPYFRIPKYSAWEVDEAKKIQYRRVDGYMSHLEIPITTNPFRGDERETWSFHYPLSVYTEMLADNGFVIEEIEEWVSDKKSEGGKAEMEDKARREFPLFMAILAKKTSR
jgi:ubiquinone/menaquinone biosynthesis C-methylase UbiE